MKSLDQVVACVVDYGNFICLADKLGESMAKVYYYSPQHETEFLDVRDWVHGRGVSHIERIDEFFSRIDEIDLFVFPDIGMAGMQDFLVRGGKAVWGSRRATELELYRTMFIEVLDQVQLPVPEHKIIIGLAALTEHLKRNHDKWVKIDMFRANMETWHHIDYEHSLPMLRYLADTFGGFSEQTKFVVQDPIPNAQEVGYDGFCIDGRYPRRSFQGYEKKNELYLGTWQSYDEMPEMVQRVNEAIAPVLRMAGYRNFFATEIRNEFFIDPTPRMPGQSGEHQVETITNLAEIIWAGANGELVEPEFAGKFGASATLHYKMVPGEHWKSVRIPAELQRWFKLAHYFQDGETYHFPPSSNDEVGVVIAYGDTITETIDKIKGYMAAVKDEPIYAEAGDFVDLLKDIKKGEESGIHFADEIPKPESVVS